MAYSDALVARLTDERPVIVAELENLLVQCMLQGEASSRPRVKEHLTQGAGRRIMVLKRSVENIFTLFPLTTTRPLRSDRLSDVQINLHAFVMNLYGVFDNWAWAFVIRHDLEGKIRRERVGLFSEQTKKYLPPSIKNYVSEPATSRWYDEYLKNLFSDNYFCRC